MKHDMYSDWIRNKELWLFFYLSRKKVATFFKQPQTGYLCMYNCNGNWKLRLCSCIKTLPTMNFQIGYLNNLPDYAHDSNI